MTRNSTTATALPPATMSPVGKALEEVSASFRSLLPGGRHRDARRDDGAGRGGGLRTAPFACRDPPRISLGPHAGQDWLPRWQDRDRTATGARFCWAGAGAAELGAGGGGGLARQVGDESHADQRLDAEVPARGAASGGRRSSTGWGWGVEVGRLPALRCAIGGLACGSGWPRTCPASTSWWCRSTASTSASISCWSRRSGSTRRA